MNALERKHPKVGVGVLVLRPDGSVLIHRRKGAHGTGTWGLVGGHLEWHESWEDCAVREVREETGLEVRNIRFAGVTNDPMPEEDKHYVTVFMQADYVAGEPVLKEPQRAEAWQWVHWDQLPTPRFAPFDRFVQTGWRPYSTYPTQKVKPGYYRHYKNLLYRVIGIGKIEATEEPVVVYEPLYDNPVSKLWVRPVHIFAEEVLVDGIRRPRFSYLGENRPQDDQDFQSSRPE